MNEWGIVLIKKRHSSKPIDNKSRRPRRRRMADIQVSDSSIVITPREVLRKELSTNLQMYLRKKHWRQIDLARAAGMGRDSISSYVNGRMLPSRENLEKMAKALRIEPENLQSGTPQTKSDLEGAAYEWRLLNVEDPLGWLKINRRVTPDQERRIKEILSEKLNDH